MKTKLFTKTLLASVITFAAGTSLAAPYEIIDLGKVEGGTNSFAYGINNSGEVVGYGDGPLGVDDNGNQVREFNTHALKFDSQVLDLGVLSNGSISLALAINDSGLVVGYSDEVTTETDDDGNERENRANYGVVFSGGTVTKIPGLESLNEVGVFDVNNNNLAIGNGRFDVDPDDDSGAVQRPFVINAMDGTGLTILPSLQEGSVTRQAFALSINDNGDIVGWSEVDGDNFNPQRAFVSFASDRSNLVELPTLGTVITVARDINNNGKVVGFARHSTNTLNTVAFIYDTATDSDLTRLPFFDTRFDRSVANAINDNGQVVGQALVSVVTTGINTGFLYEDNELKDLNKMIPCNSGWRIDNATNINNNGEIVGYGLRTEVVDGETINEVRAFKLMPTGGAIEVCNNPDEGDDNNSSGGSWSLFGLAVLVLFGMRRRKVS